MRTKGSAAELEARRRRAAELLRERIAPAEVARLTGVSLSSVKRWKVTLESEGEAGLAAKPHPGPGCRLSRDQQQRLIAIMRQGPRAAGYSTELWTCKRVAEIVRKRFGVSYHPDHLGRLLHQLGFSCQKPRVVAREQDPQQVEQWRKRAWPRLKKNAARATNARFPRRIRLLYAAPQSSHLGTRGRNTDSACLVSAPS